MLFCLKPHGNINPDEVSKGSNSYKVLSIMYNESCLPLYAMNNIKVQNISLSSLFIVLYFTFTETMEI